MVSVYENKKDNSVFVKLSENLTVNISREEAHNLLIQLEEILGSHDSFHLNYEQKVPYLKPFWAEFSLLKQWHQPLYVPSDNASETLSLKTCYNEVCGMQ